MDQTNKKRGILKKILGATTNVVGTAIALPQILSAYYKTAGNKADYGALRAEAKYAGAPDSYDGGNAYKARFMAQQVRERRDPEGVRKTEEEQRKKRLRAIGAQRSLSPQPLIYQD